MADRLICPVCGESNPADMEFCRNCQSRLQPLGGSLKDESDAIQPGELPTKKVTSELEPLLPQWLRDARQQARDSAAEDLTKASQQQKEAPGSSVPDLLDGLASQSAEEDDDIPDWLAQITGGTSKKKRPATSDLQVKRVELGREPQVPPAEASNIPPESAAAAPRAPEKDELGDWFKQAGAASESADFRMPKAPSAELPAAAGHEPERPAEDLSWLTSLGAEAPVPPEAPAETAPPAREEAPDWLKNLQAQQTPPPAPTPAPSPASQADVPDWLKQFDETTPAMQPAGPGGPEQPPTDFGVPDWLKELPAAPGEAQATEPAPAPGEALTPSELPDWMSSLGPVQEPAGQEEAQPSGGEPITPVELPDWISSLGGAQETEVTPPQQPVSNEAVLPSEMPDWISALGGEAVMPQPTEPEPASSEPAAPVELPDWISSLGAGQAAPETSEQQPAFEEPIAPAELPDRVSTFGAEQAAAETSEQQPAVEEPIAPAALPDWISALGAESSVPQATEDHSASDEAIIPAELPDWLSSLGTEPAAPQTTEERPAPEQAFAPSEVPGWISSLGGTPPPAEETKPLSVEPELPATEIPAPGPAFTADVPATEDVDAVFASMQAPDWLSSVLPSSEEAEEPAAVPAPASEEPIAPAELPSWVQAMRPVESVLEATAGAEEDVAIEKRGPLAGLHGVLPTVPGAGEPSSKPRPQSFKLTANEQQLAHAALLERILAAETSPIPMKTGAVLGSQKVLRWLISLMLLVVLAGVVFGGSQIFALPSGVPNETMAAISAVEAIPADAPVLVVFDYQPATVGEMEAAAGPLLDHMLVLNPPRFALLSTSPTGSALAERFMSRVLSARAQLVPDQQYVNLGYLPGGLAGVYSFALNPTMALPLDNHLRSAWQSSSFLAPVHNLSDFAAIIVITDSVESGRTWIEQTSLGRGKSPLVLVASAQAAPILLPYVDSGQVAGMVAGIYGAVGVEQKNAGSPACIGRYADANAAQDTAKGPSCVRRYWDAYSVGLYLAVAFITLGALWNLGLRLRERRAQAVG